MAIGVSVEVDSVGFEGAMQRLRAAVQKGLIDPTYGTLPTQARLLAERCQQLTPPKNQGQGVAAVASDLTRIYFPQEESTYSEKRMKRIVREDRREDWNAAAQHFGNTHGLRNTIAVGFSESLHLQNRTARYRTRRAKYGNIGLVTLGPQAEAARNYIDKVKRRVGWAKAGWNKGIIAFGGMVKRGWISRHGDGHGFVADGMQSSDPFVQVGNDTAWASNDQSNAKRVVRMALAGRIRDMENYAMGVFRRAADGAMQSRGGFGSSGRAAA